MSAGVAFGRPRALAVAFGLAAVLGWAPGCQHAEVAVPALLPGTPTAACLAEAADFAAAQTGRSVTLVPGTFGDSPTLLLEAPVRRGADGLPLDGRARSRPDAFALVTRAGRCEMVHAATGARRTLGACSCRAAG